MLLMAWAVVYQERLLQGLLILLLIFWFWMLYYNLGLSFLVKSLTIFISGLMVWLVVYGLKQVKLNQIRGDKA